MSERDLNLALDTVDQDLCDTEYSEDFDEDLVDETDQMFDELDEESVVEYKNDIDDETDQMFDELDEESVVEYKNDIDDEDDVISFDEDDIYDEAI